MRDRWISGLLFVLVSSMAYATAMGITSSNDGSHYALLRAMLDEGRFSIDSFAQHAEGNDIAVREGVIYSDRPPGTAIMALPFYTAGRVLPAPLRPMAARYDEGHPPLATLLMFPAMVGALTTVLLYSLLRQYELSQPAAVMASAAYAFGTTLWKYSGVLYSHAPSALLILGGVALAIRAGRVGRLHPSLAALLGVILGAAVVVEYSNAVFVALALLYVAGIWLATSLREGERRNEGRDKPYPYRMWAALGIGLAIPAAFLLMYNTVNFGGPLTTSYQYAINYPWAASFRTTFDVPLARGLPGMLWYGVDLRDQPNQGLFLLMPVTLIGLAGVWPYLRRWRHEAVFVLGTFLIALLLFAKHHTFSGFTFDGRYLMPFLALWFVPTGFALDRLWGMDESVRKMALLTAAFGLLFVSVRNMMAHIGFSYGYHLDPGLAAHAASTPASWGYILGSIFVNLLNVPLLWLVEAVILALWLGVRLLVQRAQKPQPAPPASEAPPGLPESNANPPA